MAYAAFGLCARGVINDTIAGTAEAEKFSGWGHTKGQLISEQIYAVLNLPQMQRNIARISALASKMGQIEKVKQHY